MINYFALFDFSRVILPWNLFVKLSEVNWASLEKKRMQFKLFDNTELAALGQSCDRAHDNRRID